MVVRISFRGIDIVPKIAAIHVRRTLRQLARDLPVYNVFIDAETGEIGEPERDS